jgi:2,3-diketo-5-methylthio-1-phosphopentane phosphatase
MINRKATMFESLVSGAWNSVSRPGKSTARWGAVLVDFDGTASATDVTNSLLAEFSHDDWQSLDEQCRRGELPLRVAIERQAAMLHAEPKAMLKFVLANHKLRPEFARFVRWCNESGIVVAVVSDGLGFFVRPMLEAEDLAGLLVVANAVRSRGGRLRLVAGKPHPTCRGCATCKAAALDAYRSPSRLVAYVGDGESDRFAVHYADAVFARGRLAELCELKGIDFMPWTTFEDVWQGLESAPGHRHGPPSACPGWIVGCGSQPCAGSS